MNPQKSGDLHAGYVERIVASLSDPASACRPAAFPQDPIVAAQPGLYAWRADDDAVGIISAVLKDEVSPVLYAGQAGATKQVAGIRNDRTVADRVLRDDLGDQLAGSTFRISLAAILRDSLSLQLIGPKLLDPTSGARLTRWMDDHLQVAIHPYPVRDDLEQVKRAVLLRLHPPLCLESYLSRTPGRLRLSELRQAIYHPV